MKTEVEKDSLLCDVTRDFFWGRGKHENDEMINQSSAVLCFNSSATLGVVVISSRGLAMACQICVMCVLVGKTLVTQTQPLSTLSIN